MGIPISEGGMELVKDMWSKVRAKRGDIRWRDARVMLV